MTLAIRPWLCFFQPPSTPTPTRAQRPEQHTPLARRLCCHRCRQPIAHGRDRIAVNGMHEHRYRNPHGFWFRIGCFKAASGCAADGVATDAHTWFPGYAWRLDVCRGCGLHLGWCYTRVDAGFHGLILDRLVHLPG